MFRDARHSIADNPAALHYGLAVVDVDGDGAFEVIITGFGGPNRMLKWTDCGFVDIEIPIITGNMERAIAVAGADIDGDGREEIYLLNADSFSGPKQHGDHLFSFDAGQWRDLFDEPGTSSIRNQLAGRSVACVDRLGSGRFGFVVANYGGPMRLYEMDERGRLRDRAPIAGLDAVSGGRSLLCQPLVTDRMDIFCGNESGRNFLYACNDDGTYEDVAEQVGVDDPDTHARGVAMVDLIDNGLPGLVVGNWLDAHRMFAREEYGGSFVDVAPLNFTQPSPVRTVIAADFDNDGFVEIFINNIDWPNRLFGKRAGEWQEIDMGAAAEPDGLGTGAVVGDFDGDGQLELLIAHGESAPQPLSLYRCATGSENNYLRVYPTTPAGAPARGAMIELAVAGRTQIRAIDAGSGYLCQMEPVAHFGLGMIDAAEYVDIRWPDGAMHRVEQPQINTTIHVAHPAATAVR